LMVEEVFGLILKGKEIGSSLKFSQFSSDEISDCCKSFDILSSYAFKKFIWFKGTLLNVNNFFKQSLWSIQFYF